MDLTDILTLQEISSIYNIPVTTLQGRLLLKSFNLIEDEDYRKLGKGQSILFSPIGIKKITRK